MRIRLRVFATLVKLVPGATAGVASDLELPAGATLVTVVAQLHLPADEVKVVFVNGRARPLDWVLSPDDEVGIFPPVGGG